VASDIPGFHNSHRQDLNFPLELALRQVRSCGVTVMMTPEEYRAQAEECEKQAKLVRDHSVKEGYLDLARQWRALAEQAEQGHRLGRK
jgi:hypothetical protein